MKLSRRGKSARRGRHTKRAGNNLRYKGKKVRGSKRYHRGRGGGRVRTYKRGRRFQRGGKDNFKVVWQDATGKSKNTLLGRAYSLMDPVEPTFFYLTYKKKNLGLRRQRIEIDPSNANFTVHSIEELTDDRKLNEWTRKDKNSGEENKYNFNFPESRNNLRTISEAITAKINELTIAAADALAAATIAKQEEIKLQNQDIELGKRSVSIGDSTENYLTFKNDLEKLASTIKNEDTTPDKTQKVDNMVTNILKKRLDMMIRCNVTSCRFSYPREDLEEIDNLVERLKLLAPKLYEQNIEAQKARTATSQLTTSSHNFPRYAYDAESHAEPNIPNIRKYATDSDGSTLVFQRNTLSEILPILDNTVTQRSFFSGEGG